MKLDSLPADLLLSVANVLHTEDLALLARQVEVVPNEVWTLMNNNETRKNKLSIGTSTIQETSLPSNLTLIATQSTYALGMDNMGVFWRLNNNTFLSGKPFVLAEVGSDSHVEPIREEIALTRLGEWVNACFVEGRGIAIWHIDLTVGSKKGQNSIPEVTKLLASIIPGTESGIQDFVNTGKTLICLMEDGSAHTINLLKPHTFEDPFDKDLDESTLEELNNLVEYTGGFVEISGYRSLFSLVCQTGKLVLGSGDPEQLEACVVDNLNEIEHATMSQTGLYTFSERGDLNVYNVTEPTGWIEPDAMITHFNIREEATRDSLPFHEEPFSQTLTLMSRYI